MSIEHHLNVNFLVKCIEPVKVVFAIHFSFFVETLFVEQLPAELAPDAGRVPGLVQDLEQEPIPDRPETSRALVRRNGQRLVHREARNCAGGSRNVTGVISETPLC